MLCYRQSTPGGWPPVHAYTRNASCLVLHENGRRHKRVRAGTCVRFVWSFWSFQLHLAFVSLSTALNYYNNNTTAVAIYCSTRDREGTSKTRSARHNYRAFTRARARVASSALRQPCTRKRSPFCKKSTTCTNCLLSKRPPGRWKNHKYHTSM